MGVGVFQGGVCACFIHLHMHIQELGFNRRPFPKAATSQSAYQRKYNCPRTLDTISCPARQHSIQRDADRVSADLLSQLTGLLTNTCAVNCSPAIVHLPLGMYSVTALCLHVFAVCLSYCNYNEEIRLVNTASPAAPSKV